MTKPRLAWWSPLPPAPSGIADYSSELLGAISKQYDTFAVVDDASADLCSEIDGVTVLPVSQRGRLGAVVDVYQMGNHLMHLYMHRFILETPGVLVLHDPSLVGFYEAICGGMSSVIFQEEVAHNIGSPWVAPEDPVACRDYVLRPEVLMSRRLIESSKVTIVHSGWVADALRQRSPGADVRFIPQYVQDRPATPLPSTGIVGSCTVGVLGGLSPAKRVLSVITAVARCRREGLDVRLVIAGRADVPSYVDEVRKQLRDEGLDSGVIFELDTSLERLQELVEACDVVVGLRVPTTGETSAMICRALAAGRPVAMTEIPQSRDLSPEFCWTVPSGAREVDALHGVLSDLARSPDLRAVASKQAARFIAETATIEQVVPLYFESIETCAASRCLVTVSERMDASAPPAVNAIGNWSATTGLAEAARRSVAALLTAGVEVALDDVAFVSSTRVDRLPNELARLARGRPHPVDICFLNINETPVVSDELLRGPPTGLERRMIGYWYWELPFLPPWLAAEVPRVDEIWVASTFVAETMQSHTKNPVVVMPIPVEPTRDDSLARHDFGLPSDSVVYLFSFDATSTFARKNPWAVIRAFKMAFTRAEREREARLVVKVINLSRFAEARLQLRTELASANGILIEDDLSSSEFGSLLSLADVYVSLHRAEGFGLGIAESMYFGVPAIATAYSGNMDFMSSVNSIPVGYRMGVVREDDLRFNAGASAVYVPGNLWADPDVGQASRAMRLLYEHPELRSRLGHAGSETIRARYNSTRVGEVLRSRLESLDAGGFADEGQTSEFNAEASAR